MMSQFRYDRMWLWYQVISELMISRMRTRRVARERGRPADDRVARVVEVEIRILFLRRRVLRENGVLEAGLLEHLLPVLDAFLHIAAPAQRRRRVDVVDDGLDRLDELTARVRRRILRLEPPPCDERLRLGLLHVEAVVDAVDVEESDARVERARAHRDPGQQHERLPRLHRHRRAAGVGRRTRGVERLHLAHFDVDGKPAHAADVAARLVVAADAVRGPLRRAQARRDRIVGAEEIGDVDDVAGAVAVVRGDGEGREHRRIVVLRDAARDRERVVGDHVDVDATQHHAIVHALPTHEPLVERAARALESARSRRHAGDARDHQEVATEKGVGNLEEVAVVDLVHRDAASVSHGAGGDHLRVRTRSAARAGGRWRRVFSGRWLGRWRSARRVLCGRLRGGDDERERGKGLHV
jgi:hypothetical protein